jgi:hypothetical protein
METIAGLTKKQILLRLEYLKNRRKSLFLKYRPKKTNGR